MSLAFSLYLRHVFCSESEDVEANRVKLYFELLSICFVQMKKLVIYRKWSYIYLTWSTLNIIVEPQMQWKTPKIENLFSVESNLYLAQIQSRCISSKLTATNEPWHCRWYRLRHVSLEHVTLTREEQELVQVPDDSRRNLNIKCQYLDG